MGQKIILADTFSDATLPILRDDKLLSAGSLLLHDLTHSADPFAAGVPSSGAFIPNLAWAEAAALIGAGDQNSLRSTFTHNLTGSDGVIERSGKGGLHVEIKQSGYTNGRGAYLRSATAIEAYVEAHPNNDYYFSVCSRVTRAALAGSPSESFSAFVFNATAGALANRLFGFYRSGYDPASGHWRADPGKNTVGDTFRNVGIEAWSGTVPAAGQARVQPVIWGNGGMTGLSAGNTHPSSIFYRCYLEDLTVSGRTYAEVDALDHALWVELMGTGGRYDGDTFTAPT